MRLSLLMAVAISMSACAVTRQARLYDLQSADILVATYRDAGAGRGPIWIGDTQATARCTGEYVTVPHGAAGWGSIYRGTSVTTTLATVTESDQPGQAIVTCMDGRVIECEYITSALTGGGSGSCRDNRSATYRLMF